MRVKTILDVSILETGTAQAYPHFRDRYASSGVEDGDEAKATNMAFAGSEVLEGRLLGVTVAIG